MCSISKGEKYDVLVKERKVCHRCDGLRNPSDGELAGFDSDQIGPWTRLHGDLDADLMIIGQDWGDVRYYTQHEGLDDLQTIRGRDDLRNPTMRTLNLVLDGMGFHVPFDYDHPPCKLFLTNAVLCLKDGGLQAEVNPVWFENCACFLRRQIQIVAPRVAVALGERAYKAVIAAFCPMARAPAFGGAVADENGFCLSKTTRLLATYHTGARGLINHPADEHQISWQRVRGAMRRNPCTACLNGQGYPHPYRAG